MIDALAAVLGVSQARISKIEPGEIAGIDVVRAYVSALGGSIDVVARIGDRSWKVAGPPQLRRQDIPSHQY